MTELPGNVTAPPLDVCPTIDPDRCAPPRQGRWPLSALASALVHLVALLVLGFCAMPDQPVPASLALEFRWAAELPVLDLVSRTRPAPVAQVTLTAAGPGEDQPQAEELTAALAAIETANHLSPPSVAEFTAAVAELGAAAGTAEETTSATPETEPARRKIRFFDAPLTYGERSFVFVVDASGSMHGPRFNRARRELMATLEQLDPSQRFYVVFFNEYDFPQFHPQRTREYLAATPENVQRVRNWLNSLRATGDTHPMSAIRKGLELRPDALYLLSDGAFELRTLSLIRQFNKHGTKIHTIGLEDPAGESLLKAIAEEYGGEYHFVK